MFDVNTKIATKYIVVLVSAYIVYIVVSSVFAKTKTDEITGAYSAAGINLKFANGSAMVCKDNDAEIVFEKESLGTGDNRADIYGGRWSIEIGYPKSYLVAGGKRVPLENCQLQ